MCRRYWFESSPPIFPLNRIRDLLAKSCKKLFQRSRPRDLRSSKQSILENPRKYNIKSLRKRTSGFITGYTHGSKETKIYAFVSISKWIHSQSCLFSSFWQSRFVRGSAFSDNGYSGESL